jgi:membrane-associated HD superfamily phosphohydrolase
MKLSKEQITTIEDYLKENGVKYWDIRLELIDHLASKLEKQDQIDLTKTLLIKEFGTYASLEYIQEEKRKSINKKYRKLFFQEVLNFFKSTKNILTFIVLSFFYYQFYKHLNTKVFLKLSVLLAFIPVIIALLFQFYIWIKKNKSIYLATALFYFMFTFLLYNMVIQLTINDSFFEIPGQTQGVIILISLPFYLVGMFSGFKVFNKTHKEYTKIYNELQTI